MSEVLSQGSEKIPAPNDQIEAGMSTEPKSEVRELVEIQRCNDNVDMVEAELKRAESDLQRVIDQLADKYDLRADTIFDFTTESPAEFIGSDTQKGVPREVVGKIVSSVEWQTYVGVERAYRKSLAELREATKEVLAAFPRRIREIDKLRTGKSDDVSAGGDSSVNDGDVRPTQEYEAV